MEATLIVQGITLADFFTKIEAIVEVKVKETLIEMQSPKKTDRYLTRKEVSGQLKISLPTLHDWTKLGWLKSYKI